MGIKNMKQNKSILKYMLMLFLLLAFTWGFQFYNLKQEEKQAVSMVYQMLGEWQEGRSGEQIAADLLKGNANPEAVDVGMNILEEYGYNADYESVYSKWTRERAVRLALFYLALYVVICGVLWGYGLLYKKNREKEHHQLQDILERFYSGVTGGKFRLRKLFYTD